MSSSKITKATTEGWRRTPEQITTLARESVTGQCLVTDDPDAIRCAFYMVLAFLTFTEPARKQVGALIGYNNEAVPGRAMNGYPIYCSVGFLHRDDVEAFNAEVARMMEALHG